MGIFPSFGCCDQISPFAGQMKELICTIYIHYLVGYCTDYHLLNVILRNLVVH